MSSPDPLPRRFLSFRTGAILALALMGAACAREQAEAPASPSRPVVETVAAAPYAGAGVLRASGVLAYQRETLLAFNLPGLIEQIAVDEGDSVPAGAVLAALRLTTVQAGEADAAATLETAERALARTQALFDRDLVAQARLDEARLSVERARAARAAAGFARETAVLTAPAAGVILRRFAEPAQATAGGAPILLLGETGSGLIARAAVGSAAAARLLVGVPAEVVLSHAPDAPRAGRVERIAAKSDGATGAFDVEVRLEDAEGLRSGMIGEVRIRAPGAAPGALALPVLSLLDARADQGVVYVVDDDGVAHRRSIRTAGVLDGEVLVVEGLSAGERVVARGAAFVRDGEPVRTAPTLPP